MANFFHDTLKIGNYTSIEISSRNTHTFIGAHAVIDDFVKIKHVGGKGDIRIGEYVYINSFCVLYSGNGILIGNNVLIGPNCNLVPVNHEFLSREIPMRLQGFAKTKGGIIIEDDVWLGAGLTILDGTHIKKGTIVGANSLVSGILDEYSIYGGNPLTKIKSRL